MHELILKLMAQLNSSVFILVGIFAVVCFGIYKVGRLVEKFGHHEERIERLTSLSETVVELRTKIDLIYQPTNPNSPLRAFSPISLTPIGEEISAQVKADEILRKYLPKLESEVENESPKSAYDIQMSSMAVVKKNLLKLLDEKELMSVKQEAYNRGLLVEDIVSVFGVLLRNNILVKKGFSISEVDTQ